MTVPKLIAILAIFCCSAAAWFVLGVSVAQRSGTYDHRLEAEVTTLWGGRHVQQAPEVWMGQLEERTETVEETGADGAPTVRQVTQQIHGWRSLPLGASRVGVSLQLEHRRRGLLWYDLYRVTFSGRYTLVAPEDISGPLRVAFRFPSPESIYDGFSLRVAGIEATAGDLESAVVVVVDDPDGGESIPIEIDYASRGLDTWSYAFREHGVGQVADFELVMTTDFDAVDFLAGTLSPTERTARPAAGESGQPGERLTWRFENLVTGKRLGVDLPNRLNPGPLTQRVTFFAPVSLLFFLSVMVIFGIVQDRNLHPMHYFFLSAAFFSFHLLLAYLVDHVSIRVAFAAAAAVSLFLVISYLRVVGDTRFAVAQAGLAQLVYLVLFNYAFFFDGFTGLAITVVAIVTLFALMQLTAEVEWDGVFGARRATPEPG